MNRDNFSEIVEIIIIIVLFIALGLVMYSLFSWNHDLHQNIDKGLIRLN